MRDSITSEQDAEDFAKQKEFKTGFLRFKMSRGQINKLAKAALSFCEHLAGVELYPYEKEFGMRLIQSLLSDDGEDISALFSRQSGKTETVSVIVNGCLVLLPIFAQAIKDKRLEKYKKGFWVGVFSPSYEQSSTMYTRMITKISSTHAKSILSSDEFKIYLDDRRQRSSLSLPNGSFVDCNTAAKQAKIEGKTYHLLIMEEAQDIDPFTYRKSISPMGAAVNASQVKIGTCNMLRSDFYDTCQRNVQRDRYSGDKTHFQYDYEVASKYNHWYKKYIEREKERLGYDSDEFRMAYRLHWILERGMFVEPTLFEQLGGDYTVSTYDVANPIVVGIDFGKLSASTVVTVIQPDYTKGQKVGEDDFRCFKKIINWLELKGDDYVSQFYQIVDFLDNYKVLSRICLDATGVGQPLYDMFLTQYDEQIAAGKLQIIGFEASTQSNHDGYLRLQMDFQNHRVTYPNSERSKKFQKQRNFCNQMLSLIKQYRGAYLVVETMEERIQKDYCSSLMLAAYGCDTQEVAREVEETPNVFFEKGDRRRDRVFARDRAWWRNEEGQRPERLM